jgi:hypothetical protein
MHDAAYDELHAATPPGWYVGRQGYNGRCGEKLTTTTITTMTRAIASLKPAAPFRSAAPDQEPEDDQA